MPEIPIGRFAWYELMTTEPDAAPDFYGKIAGWGTMGWDGGPEPYTMWTNGEQPIGGVMQLPEEAVAQGAPPHWLVHISTPNVDATAAKATELGAQVMHTMDVPSVGRFAIILDPQGAVFSAYQPENDAPGHDGLPQLGEFSWNELMTTDAEAAWSFYSEVFGWNKADAMDMGEMGMYQMFDRGAHTIGGMMKRPPEMPVSSWLFYVRVPDMAQAAEMVKELGGQVVIGPMEVPGGDMVAQCSDPQGAAFAIHMTASQESEAGA